MSFLFQHTKLGWCWWDLIALVILLGVCVYSYSQIRKMKKLEKTLNDRLIGMSADAATSGEHAFNQ